MKQRATSNEQRATSNLAIAFAAAVILGSANAATISWTGVTATTLSTNSGRLNIGLFDKTGTLIRAENSGGSATTFDGIAFTSGVTSFGSTADNTFHADLSILSRSATFRTIGSGIAGLVNLTIGNTYRVQALLFDGRGGNPPNGRSVAFDGINLGSYANGVTGSTWGSGLLVTGTFVADNERQQYTVEIFNADDTSAGGQLNAFTLYQTAAAVPEPSSVALLGLGGLALILRRRK